MRTIYWKCTLGPNWQWQSASAGNPSFRTPGDDARTGIITLPPNPDYWYLCESVTLGTLVGTAVLRYFKDAKGTDLVEAKTIAPGQWTADGQPNPEVSKTQTQGGINLTAVLA